MFIELFQFFYYAFLARVYCTFLAKCGEGWRWLLPIKAVCVHAGPTLINVKLKWSPTEHILQYTVINIVHQMLYLLHNMQQTENDYTVSTTTYVVTSQQQWPSA